MLVDSNVLIDVMGADPIWASWSKTALEIAMDRDEVGINPVIYAEVAAGFSTKFDLDIRLAAFAHLPLPFEAGFIASRAFLEYRRRGGERRSPLPDFYIGAHAAVAGLALLTRDARRYRTYFPRLRLVTPD